ncbi:MAG: hypothetical protein ABH860_03425 [bacterium]
MPHKLSFSAEGGPASGGQDCRLSAEGGCAFGAKPLGHLSMKIEDFKNYLIVAVVFQ